MSLIGRNNSYDQEEVFKKLSDFIDVYLDVAEAISKDNVIELIKVCNDFYPDEQVELRKIIENKLPVVWRHRLWMIHILDICQVDFIASNILAYSDAEKREIFNRCSLDDKLNVLFKIIYDFEKVDNELKFDLARIFLRMSMQFAQDNYDKIVNAVLNICSSHYKLSLWLDDYHEHLDFNEFKLYTITLPPVEQKRFVKKVLKYIHEQRVQVSIDDLTSINVTDFETSKLAERIDQCHLDYSTSIVLNVISELQNKNNIDTTEKKKLAERKIYELILNQIRDPRDILHISGFFDECTGRCNVDVVEIKNDEGEVIDKKIVYQRKEHDKARYHPICDGRKAIDKNGLPALSKDKKLEFWWCENKPCYKTSRELHNSKDWEKYTLIDFLNILKVDFNEDTLEIYLNIINKANRFLSHLKGGKCNNILHPKSKYAFWGITWFYCNNISCVKCSEYIYLSHCLNGFCGMVIDSRDSVKCKPEGFAESCGWYVCNFFHSCCTTPQLIRRKKDVYEDILRIEYKCHHNGHRELGIISCNKCGSAMESKKGDVVEYERILNWFINNIGKSPRIRKGEKNIYGWWFIVERGQESYEKFREKLDKYLKLGFRVPGLGENKNSLYSGVIKFEKAN